MSTCIIVLKEKQLGEELLFKLRKAQTPINSYDLVEPLNNKTDLNNSDSDYAEREFIKEVNFNKVNILNPKLERKNRQKLLATWLIPFGFITGLGFSQMTGLETFSDLGFPNQFEKLIGGLVGMLSGWLGSFFASGGINQDINDDLRALQKKSEQGFWLLIIEMPIEIEPPWNILKEVNSLEIITIGKQ